jgi:hypothetical protein
MSDGISAVVGLLAAWKATEIAVYCFRLLYRRARSL